MVMLDNGQVERPDGGSDCRHHMRHSAAAENSRYATSTSAAGSGCTATATAAVVSSSSSSSGFLFGAGRRHEPVTSREFRIVRLLMGFEYRGPGERLATQRTPERSFTGVHATVVFHVVSQLERFAAELALEWPVASVRGQVAHQGGHVRERFAAKLTECSAAAAVIHCSRAVVVARL